MLEINDNETITRLLVENIEIIEFEKRISDEFNENLLNIESIIGTSYILKEEITLILKLKFFAESSKNDGRALDIIKKMLIALLEITEFKTMITDKYGIGKGGYWSFRKDFHNKQLDVMKLEYEFYSILKNPCDVNCENFDSIALSFKKSLDKTNRRGWL